jgi:hypothetical protein
MQKACLNGLDRYVLVNNDMLVANWTTASKKPHSFMPYLVGFCSRRSSVPSASTVPTHTTLCWIYPWTFSTATPCPPHSPSSPRWTS